MSDVIKLKGEVEMSQGQHILITRPIEDAEVLAQRLEALGNQVTVAPMLDIYVLDDAKVEIEAALDQNPQAIILTSGNGARALAHLTDRRDIPVIAVGEASAMAARHRGFTADFCANGDVEKLEEYIRSHCDKDNGPLLHIAGSVVAGDLKTHLQADGYSVERVTGYLAKPIVLLSETLKDQIRDGVFDAVMFYSPRTADVFLQHVKAEELSECFEEVSAYCLSPRVAETIASLSWKSVHQAQYPTQDGIISLLKDAADTIDKIAS